MEVALLLAVAESATESVLISGVAFTNPHEREVAVSDSAAPGPWPSECAFSSRQAYSGPRSIWNHVQAQRNASEVPERAVFLRGDRFRGGWGFQRVED